MDQPFSTGNSLKLRCFVNGKVSSTPIQDFKNLDELMDHLMEEDFHDTSFQHPDGRLMRFERINWADFRKHYRHPKQRQLKMRNTSSGGIFVLDLIPESSSEGA